LKRRDHKIGTPSHLLELLSCETTNLHSGRFWPV
jgi:hypothetical protein